MERKLLTENPTHHGHSGHPEEKDIPSRLQHRIREKSLEIRAFFIRPFIHTKRQQS